MRDQLLKALQAADAAGNTEDARVLAQELARVSGYTPRREIPDSALASVGLGSAFQEPTTGVDRLAQGIERGVAMTPLERNMAARQQVMDAEFQAEFDQRENPATLADYGRAYSASFADGLGDAVNYTNRLGNLVADTLIGNPVRVLGGPDLTSPLQQEGPNPLHRMAEGIRGNINAGFGALQQDNQWGVQTDEAGNPVGPEWDPRNWTLGDDPTVAGFMATGMNVLGTLAPTVVAGLVSGGSAAPAVVGGTMAGGAGAKEAEAAVDAMWADGTIEQESARFRELVADGMAPEAAYQQVRKDAGDWAGAAQGVIGGVGGALTGRILSPANQVFARAPGAVRAPAVLALAQAEEAAQEATEGIAGQAALNLAAGTDRRLDEGLAENIIGGAFGGTGPGAVAAVNTLRAGRQGQGGRAEQLRRIALDDTADIADRMAALLELDQMGFQIDQEAFTPADPNRDYRNEGEAQPAASPYRVIADMAHFQTPSELQLDEAPPMAPVPEAVDPAWRVDSTNFPDLSGYGEAPLVVEQGRPAVTVDGAPVQNLADLFFQPEPPADPTAYDPDQVRAEAAQGIAELFGLEDGEAHVPETEQIDDGGDFKRAWVPTGMNDARGRPIRRPALDYSRDGLLEWLAASGGVDAEQIMAQGGADPRITTDPSVMYPFGVRNMPTVRRRGGMSLDRLLEAMVEDGWFADTSADDAGGVTEKYDVNDAVNLVMRAMSGERVYHPTEGAEARLLRQEIDDENAARFQLEQEIGRLDEAVGEVQVDRQRAREQYGIEIAEADAAEAASIVELVERALDAGAPIAELGQPEGESNSAYAARLWALAEGKSNGNDTGAAQRADQGGDRREAGGPVATDPEPRREAGTPETGLFGAPTAREQAEGRARELDARRDGRTGQEIPGVGGLPLFAGDAPQQADIEDEAPSGAQRVSEMPSDNWQQATVVKGADGQPLKIHRGSRDGTTSPDAFFELGASTGHPSANLGVWFTSDAADAASYGTVGDYYLDIRNPRTYDVADFPDFDDAGEARALRQELEAEGHDGIVIDATSVGGPVQYVAFKPEQVKSPADLQATPAEGGRGSRSDVERRRALAEQNDLMGENAPESRASMQALLDDPNAPRVSGTLTNGADENGNRIPDWTPAGNGFSARQYVRDGVAVQEVRSPTGAIARRRMDSDGVTSADLEASATLDDVLSGAAFSEFNDFFQRQGALPPPAEGEGSALADRILALDLDDFDEGSATLAPDAIPEFVRAINAAGYNNMDGRLEGQAWVAYHSDDGSVFVNPDTGAVRWEIGRDVPDARGVRPSRERTPHPKSTAPEHQIPAEGITPMSVEQIAKVAREWREHIDGGGDAEITHVFDAPAPDERVRLADKVRVHTAEHGWMTLEEARERVNEWKARAREQGHGNRYDPDNAQKVVLSLFDKTGAWAEPWEQAGYQVYTFDIQNDPEIGDVNNFSVEHFVENFGMFEGADVYAVLAACPCTDFAVSGARHFAEKDADGRTQLSVQLVRQTLATIEYFKPPIWAIENPVGRIEKLGGLPPWRLAFDPYMVGPHPYTKRTQIWGRFNGDLPIAPVKPTEGSKMHSRYGGRSQATKDARSETPEGFAYAFFMANNAKDNPLLALANKYDRLDPDRLQAALDAGISERDISDAIDDHWYDYNDDAAHAALDELIAEARGEAESAAPATLHDPAIDDGTDAEDMRDELRRRRKAKTKRKAGPVTATRADAPLAYELDIFLDNGLTEEDLADMPPQQKARVAARIVRETFGFESVDVAKNLNTLTAINQLTFAYRNLQSMAAVLAWPSEAIGKLSPNLELTRGGGNALASYSPGERKIRLSEQHDAFAHEFGHGIDWWVWQTMKLVDPATGEPKGRAATGKLRLGGELTNRPVERAFHDLNRAMFKDQGDAALKIASIEKHILVIRNQIATLQDKAELATDPERRAKIEQTIEKREAHIKRLAAQISEIRNAPKPQYTADSNYYLNARLLDKAHGLDGGGDSSSYWQRPTEMFARAFEAWVANRVEAAGGGTEFLGRTDAGYLESSVEFIEKAYPQALDRERIFLAIDELMNVLRDDVLHGLDGKPLAQVQSPDPLPPRAWMHWVPNATQRRNVSGWFRESMELARSQRELNAKEDQPLKAARAKVRAARNDGRVAGLAVGEAATDWALRMHDAQRDFTAGWAASVAGFLKTMEARYPQSGTFRQISRIFAINPGSGQLRQQTYEEYQQSQRAYWSGLLGNIARRHNLNSPKVWTPEKMRELRDALVDHREGDERPTYSAEVKAAAADLRTFHDELWQAARNAGFEIGYTKNGYLQRIVDQASVSADQAGFLRAAGQVYAEVFEGEVSTLENPDYGALAEAAQQVLGRRDPEYRELRNLLAQHAAAEANGDPVDEIEQQLQDLLEGGLYERIQREWSAAAASDWMGRVLGTTTSGDFGVQSAQGRFMKSRALPQSADIIMGDFMVTDPRSLAATYMASVINRMAFDRFIPKIQGEPDASPARRVDDLRARLVRDGVLEGDIEETMASIRVMTGLYRPNMTSRGLRTQSNIYAAYAPVVLGRALWSQWVEPATAGLVSGSPVDTAAMFGSQIADLANWLPGIGQLARRLGLSNGAEWRREMAAFIGAVSDAHFDTIMANRENTLFANKKAGQTLANFFLYSGIHPHAMSIRRAAMERSIHYLKRIARKARAGNALARRDLADFGIDAGNAELVEYLAEQMPLRPTVQELSENPHAAEITTAMNRFVDRVSQNPKIVDKPRLASTAERSYLYVVLSFQSAFTQNVLMAEARRLKTTLSQDGITEGGKLATVAAANMAIFMALHTAQYLMRVAVYGDLEDELERWAEDPSEAVMTIFSRAGLFGMGDPLVNAFGGFKYDRALSELGVGAYVGAALGWASQVGRAQAKDSENTNTAEHKTAREIWYGVIAPIIGRVILSRAPGAAFAMSFVSSPAAKEQFADTLVGERDSKREASEKTPDNQQTRGQNRGQGRGEGRGNSRGNDR